MKTPRERILLVENDPDICDLIARQTLPSLGYRLKVVDEAPKAIQEAGRYAPDLVIANLNLPGLSGKDLLVALSSQGLEIPVIVVAQKGMESDLIQAFRLGASDYLLWPAREAEVVSAVERVLKQVRIRQERETLAAQLQQANQELHSRVRELTTIFALSKGITSVTIPRELAKKIVEGAIYVTEADYAWFLLSEEDNKTFFLAAQRNLPPEMSNKLGHHWEDGISSLVALSGETISIHGEPLARFQISQLGKSAMVIPVKIRREIAGLLTVLRKAPVPFSSSNQVILEALADYASISLVNARLFQARQTQIYSLQKKVESAQAGERAKDELIRNLRRELSLPLTSAIERINSLLVRENDRLNAAQKGVLRSTEEKLKQVSDFVESLNTFNLKA